MQIFDVYVYVYVWLQEHVGHSNVIQKCARNIDRPFQIPRTDIRLRRLPADTRIHIVYYGLV